MNRIDVRDLKGKIKPNAQAVTLTVGERKQNIQLAYQKTGISQKRFFLCPRCGKRVEYLYINNGILKCRKCSGVRYKGIQDTTKGSYDEIAYRMKRYADKYNIIFDFPFDYIAFANDSRINKQQFRKHLIVLQALENMRFQALFYKTRYSSKLLSQVIKGEHPILQQVTLLDLRENIYDWKTGKEIIQCLSAKDVLRL